MWSTHASALRYTLDWYTRVGVTEQPNSLYKENIKAVR